MTTIREAEERLFNAPAKRDKAENVSAKPDRCRVQPIYCPRCSGWAVVHLQPVRLHCTGCGLEPLP